MSDPSPKASPRPDATLVDGDGEPAAAAATRQSFQPGSEPAPAQHEAEAKTVVAQPATVGKALQPHQAATVVVTPSQPPQEPTVVGKAPQSLDAGPGVDEPPRQEPTLVGRLPQVPEANAAVDESPPPEPTVVGRPARALESNTGAVEPAQTLPEPQVVGPLPQPRTATVVDRPTPSDEVGASLGQADLTRTAGPKTDEAPQGARGSATPTSDVTPRPAAGPGKARRAARRSRAAVALEKGHGITSVPPQAATPPLGQGADVDAAERPAVEDPSARRELVALVAGAVAVGVLLVIWLVVKLGPPPLEVGKALPLMPKAAQGAEPTRAVATAVAPPAVDLEPVREAADAEAPTGSGFGTVRIVTEPECAVTADGRELGTTPVLVKLPAGKNPVLLENQQLFFKRTVIVDVAAGEQASVRFDFAHGWIEVSAPAGTRISVDGRAAPTSPVHVWEGAHRVEATFSDKKKSREVRAVDVSPGMTTSVHFDGPSLADE